MKILMVNKFLYPKGGAETYMLKLGKALEAQGHEVQYFGMDDEKRCVGNCAEAYARSIDFHNASVREKCLYAFKTVYSFEARRKIRSALQRFQPDVCHLNDFNYQLTPSIILEIKKWCKDSGKKCKIVYTAHDYQWLCPNHSFQNPNTKEKCTKCLNGYFHCIKGKCIHGSTARSAIGAMESFYWHRRGVYKNVDSIVCCSAFMKEKMDLEPMFVGKTVKLTNFTEKLPYKAAEKKDYVLYLGRFSPEKGIKTLVEACKRLPDIPFIFAGSGPLENLLEGIPNIQNVGFLTGEELYTLIREARFSIYPSEWYENCPFSVLESLMLGTAVLGADIGGIPELIQKDVTGELFESGNVEALCSRIRKMYHQNSVDSADVYRHAAKQFMSIEQYCKELLKIYEA